MVGSSVPMFLGAMIVGPLAAFFLKQVDRLIEEHVLAGFEMLIDNFTLGILGSWRHWPRSCSTRTRQKRCVTQMLSADDEDESS